MTASQPPAPEYIAARRVLLDALETLASHSRAVIVAGAQAVYLRTGAIDLDATIAGKQAARRAVGLEAALIDHSPVTISSLDARDGRKVVAEVAGVAALLVAKAHKLQDRLRIETRDRLSDKDAADVIRLMQFSDPAEVRTTMDRLAGDATAGPVTRDALAHIEELFGRLNGAGVQLAARAMQGAAPSERVEAVSDAYVRMLLSS